MKHLSMRKIALYIERGNARQFFEWRGPKNLDIFRVSLAQVNNVMMDTVATFLKQGQ